MTSSFHYAATTPHQISRHCKRPAGHPPRIHATKQTIKRQRIQHLPTTTTKLYHHQSAPAAFKTQSQKTTTLQSTFHAITIYTSIIEWFIHQPAIIAASTNAATKAALFAQWAWTAPGIPVLSCALAYSLTIWCIVGTTTATQLVRGCVTEA